MRRTPLYPDRQSTINNYKQGPVQRLEQPLLLRHARVVSYLYGKNWNRDLKNPLGFSLESTNASELLLGLRE